MGLDGRTRCAWAAPTTRRSFDATTRFERFGSRSSPIIGGPTAERPATADGDLKDDPEQLTSRSRAIAKARSNQTAREIAWLRSSDTGSDLGPRTNTCRAFANEQTEPGWTRGFR